MGAQCLKILTHTTLDVLLYFLKLARLKIANELQSRLLTAVWMCLQSVAMGTKRSLILKNCAENSHTLRLHDL